MTPQTSHIPVHIISVEGQRHRALRQGAFTHLQKPVTRDALVGTFESIVDFKRATVSGSCWWSRMMRYSAPRVVDLIGNTDVKTTAVGNGREALAALKDESFDCLVLDLKLPDMSGFELIESIQKDLGRARTADCGLHR